MEHKNKRNAKLKVCRRCGILLKEGKNWYSWCRKINYYQCKGCERKYRRERRNNGEFTYKNRQLYIKGIRKRYCEICKEELPLGKKKAIIHHFIYDDKHPGKHTATVCHFCHELIHFFDRSDTKHKFDSIENWFEKYTEVKNSKIN